ncbi:DHHA1 domain-containing protein [Marispirochaeta sp.]|jgi:alanyl-tRNA synthetase|uniref:alanyl-tRNA editing protein n=1 Tax=Marispirochaeta sp. TaxID=2038653 RepID=UPI0029C6B036|nr:DHHA1 domain-containing protein [Marispirochaeta sp.]
MTEKLYYKDPYRTEFASRLISSQKIDTNRGPRWQVVLEASCFYPAGGGQPSDRGTLNDREVEEVLLKDDEVIHVLSASLEDGTREVFGRIEPMHRRHYMQQHTGQHLISAVLHRLCGYPTRSVHLGELYTSIEIEGTTITPFEIVQIEDEVNRIICENRGVKACLVDQDQLKQIELRRSLKTDTNIRIVEIDDTDLVGCGGVHLRSTGEIRLVKHITTESVRGNSRLSFVIGDAAMADYREKSRIASRMVDLLSAPQGEVLSKLDEYLEKNTNRDKYLGSTLHRLNRYIAAELYDNGIQSPDGRIVTAELQEDEADQIREIADGICRIGPVIMAIAARFSGKVKWVIAAPESRPELYNSLKNKLMPLIDGKGGGKPPFWQGGGDNPDGIAAFLDTFRSSLVSREQNERPK